MAPPLIQLSFVFLLPESPRWLISQDRSEEAFQILVKYHAEGDRESEFLRAEITQIQTTIAIEMQRTKKSWRDIVATRGMRKRLLTTCMLGLFAQWSGGTLITYYLGDHLEIIGQNKSSFKQTINVSLACWSLVCSFTASMFVRRFKRRQMFLVCTSSLLVVFVCWTISMGRAITAENAHHRNQAAGGLSIFFIFAYTPCYCLALNTLAYSKLIVVSPGR